MPKVNTGLKEKDFQDGKLVKNDIDGKSIVIGMTSGKLFAMDSVCSHEGGPLEDGSLDGYNLTCPWHQGIFDIRNAKASPETSWVTDLKSYAVVVDEKGGEITVETDPTGYGNLQNDNKSVRSQQTTVDEEIVPTIPLKLELKLLEKIPKNGTDVMSFKFSKSDDHNHLKYRASGRTVCNNRLGNKGRSKRTITFVHHGFVAYRRCYSNYYKNTRYTFQKEASNLRDWIHSEDHLTLGEICTTR